MAICDALGEDWDDATEAIRKLHRMETQALDRAIDMERERDAAVLCAAAMRDALQKAADTFRDFEILRAIGKVALADAAKIVGDASRAALAFESPLARKTRT